MSLQRLPLDSLVIDHASLEAVPNFAYNVFHVKKPFALVQAAGYLKHIRAKNHNKAVYFRGQSKLYPKLPPTLYRELTNERARHFRDEAMQAFLKRIRSEEKGLRAMDEHVQEPLLQHYGIKTRWLDVVDNVWVALWFACQKVCTVGLHDKYLHFEKRLVRHAEPGEGFAYLLLLESSAEIDKTSGPGCFRDSGSATIDLRIAAPSQFIRPHAQHGLVIQARDNDDKPPLDFSPLLVGIIRVDLADAFEWLGSGDLLSDHSLFPPPSYDSGYLQLLKHLDSTDAVLGAIQHIGAGA